MKKIIFFLFLTNLFISCNDSKNNSASNDIKPDSDKPKSLRIDFRFKTTEADEFKIMMNNIEVDELQKKNIQIVESVTPSTGDDVIVANFDPNNLSKQIVLHLGGKIKKEVTIKSILVSYGNQQFNLTSPEDFNEHLVFNKFIERDSTSNKLITKRIEGKLNPTIRIKNNLINQLQRQ